MIPNKNIFCNAPWFELHIYWDGSLGFCCQENHRIYADNEKNIYNIKNMSITEWMNSQPMRDIRTSMFGDKELSICYKCQQEQNTSGTSRRHRSNTKSVIFTKQNFDESFEQSPHKEFFQRSIADNGVLNTYPIDMHIDLGNYCNLACKMCNPLASSKIANQYQKWGLDLISTKNNMSNDTGKLLIDWTRDNDVWTTVCEEIATFKNLNNIHFMGGEPMLAKRFTEFCDFMIKRNKIDFGMSFVTNGTIINYDLLERLKKFKGRIGIEISIETCTAHNDYIRQGTDTEEVLKNINTIRKICEDQEWDLTIRPAVSILSVGYYHTLLQYCLDNKLLIKSLWVDFPVYMDVKNLSKEISNQYIETYKKFIKDNELEGIDHRLDYNESDQHEFKKLIKKDVDSILNALSSERIDRADDNLKELTSWCKRWDPLYKFDARSLYPEFKEMFGTYGY